MTSLCQVLYSQEPQSRWWDPQESDECGISGIRDVDKRRGRHLNDLKSRARAEHSFEEDSEEVARGECNIWPREISKISFKVTVQNTGHLAARSGNPTNG